MSLCVCVCVCVRMRERDSGVFKRLLCGLSGGYHAPTCRRAKGCVMCVFGQAGKDQSGRYVCVCMCVCKYVGVRMLS